MDRGAWSATVLVIKQQEQNGLNNRNLFSHNSRVLKSQIAVLAGLVSLKSLCLPSCFMYEAQIYGLFSLVGHQREKTICVCHHPGISLYLQISFLYKNISRLD